MQKILLIIATICFSTVLSAQDLVNTFFNSVNDNSKTTWYKGQTRDKKPHGMGIRKPNAKDQTLLIGDFFNGEFNGYGIMVASQGNTISNCNNCIIYVGNWKNGIKSGMGTCYAKNGTVIYSGRFAEDKPVETYPSKGDFTGKYFSLNEFDNGDKYWGEVNNGSSNGFGVYVWNNGNLYFGNFKDGEEKGIIFVLMYNGEWSVMNCNGDDWVQINSSVDSKNKEAYQKAVRAQVRAQNLSNMAGALSGVAGATANVIETTQSSSTSSSSSSGGSGSGSSSESSNCNCAELKYRYGRVNDWLKSSQSHTNDGIVAGSAQTKNVQMYQRQKSEIERQASKCGCVL